MQNHQVCPGNTNSKTVKIFQRIPTSDIEFICPVNERHGFIITGFRIRLVALLVVRVTGLGVLCQRTGHRSAKGGQLFPSPLHVDARPFRNCYDGVTLAAALLRRPSGR